MTFHPQAKKVKSKDSGLEFWLCPFEHPAYNGLPVYTPRDIKILKQLSSFLNKDDFLLIYEMKLLDHPMEEILKTLKPELFEKEPDVDPYKKSETKLSPAAQYILIDIYRILGGHFVNRNKEPKI